MIGGFGSLGPIFAGRGEVMSATTGASEVRFASSSFFRTALLLYGLFTHTYALTTFKNPDLT